MIESYKEGYNRHNDKYEIDYYLTITNHKINTPTSGKKDVAYLRLERAIRSKEKVIEDPKVEGIKLPEWQTQLVHQEMYVFSSIQERLNPKAPWKDKLYLACLYRLVGAGLEYAELLQRMKNTDLNTLREQAEEETKKPDIVIAGEMPKPLTPDEEKYKKEIQEIRKQEGIN